MKNRLGLALPLSVALCLLAGSTAAQPAASEATYSRALIPDPVALACTSRPTASGALQRPEPPYLRNDFGYVHSSTHFQGRLAAVKWTGGLIHTPVLDTLLSEFTSAVVVNNPDPVQSVTIRIEYFDHLGNAVGGPVSAVIPPEGTFADGADELTLDGGRGFGSARVTVEAGPGIVGATLVHGARITDGNFEVRDTDSLVNGTPAPGAASMQQLQLKGTNTELWWGPLPVSTVSNVDFFNGEAPIYTVVNPDDTQSNTLSIELKIFNRLTGNVSTVAWRQVTLPPRGSLTDVSGTHLFELGTSPDGLWNVIGNYTGAAIDQDFLLHITSLDGLPILGDGIMTDFYGQNASSNLVPGERFRMASTMLARRPKKELIAPHFSHDPGSDGIVNTLIGITNVGTQDAGIVTIEYFNANGSRHAVHAVGSLPSGESLRIEPGALGYPGNKFNPFGWVQVSSCQEGAQLVGWAVREIQNVNQGTKGYQFHKAYGELLINNGGAEPGLGFALDGDTRKAIPLLRAVRFGDYPGYSTFVNDSVPNLGVYNWRFFDFSGFDCTSSSSFSGLPFGHSSLTYEDSLSSGCSNAKNMSGRVDHASGSISGVTVLGDPLAEYELDDDDGFVIPLPPGP